MSSLMKSDLFLYLCGFSPVAEYDADAACGGEAENPVIIPGIASLRHLPHRL